MRSVSTAVPEPSTWIDGIPERTPSTGTVLDDPNTGEPMREAHRSTEDQIDRAIAAAERVDWEGSWRSKSVGERAGIVTTFLDRVEEQIPLIAEVDASTSGIPVTIAGAVMTGALTTSRTVVQLAVRRALEASTNASGGDAYIRERIPWGPSAILGCWSLSTPNTLAEAVGAMMAGSPAVMKASPWAPTGTEILARAAASGGLPDGVLNTVVGDRSVGRRLVRDRRMRSVMVGSSVQAARRIARDAADDLTRARITANAENPVLVGPGADIHRVAARVAGGALTMMGQWNEGPRRLILAEEMLDAMVEALSLEMSLLPVGSSLDPTSLVGPFPSASRSSRFLDALDRAERDGARVLRTAEPPAAGHFVPSTIVIENKDRSLLGDEPVAGPLVVVVTAEDDDDAARLARLGAAGSHAYVFSEDLAWVRNIASRLRVGEIALNGYHGYYDWPTDVRHDLFGASGAGGRDIPSGLDFFTGHRAISLDEGSQYGWYE